MDREPTATQPPVCRVTFGQVAQMERVEQTLLLAIVAIGCLYGQAAARLDVGYTTDSASRRVVIDTSTRIGRRVALLFVGLCTHEFGDDAFGVERVGVVRPNTGGAMDAAG